MLFIYLYHGDLYSDLWKSDLYFGDPQASTSEDFHQIWGLSAGTGKLCIFGHLGLVFIWSCFVSCLLLLLYYVICAPVLTEGTQIWV